MATPSPTPTGPVYSISALARIPIKDGMKASEINKLCMSQAHTAENLAMVIDSQAHALRQVMARTNTGVIDAVTVRARAWHATRPMRQAANRIRAGAAASRASWKATERAFGALMNPKPKSGQKGPDWQK